MHERVSTKVRLGALTLAAVLSVGYATRDSLASLLTGILDIPGTHTYQSYLAAIAQYDADADHVIFRAPAAVTLVKVTYCPSADVAMNTDSSGFSTIKVLNRGTDGLGTTQYGTDVSYSLTSESKDVVRDYYSSSSGASLANGDVIVLRNTKTGLGTAIAEGVVRVQFKPK